jgi:hypothetical protein
MNKYIMRVQILWFSKYQNRLSIVFLGIVGASIYTETGGSGEYTCLTREPQYDKYTDALEGTGKIAGVEFEVGSAQFFDMSKAPSGKLQDADVVCAVCRSKAKSSQVRLKIPILKFPQNIKRDVDVLYIYGKA